MALMARGWESKSVESQQADAGEKPEKSRKPVSTEEAQRFRELETLRLSRQRVLQQLETSQNPRHRTLLQHALAELEKKLHDRSNPKSNPISNPKTSQEP